MATPRVIIEAEAPQWAHAMTTAINKALAAKASSVVVPSTLKTELPPVVPAGQLVLVSNEAGGAVLAFSDGTNFRRVTDRAVVS